jgi:hypothetical protein
MSLLKFDEAMVEKLKSVFPNVQNAQEDRVSSDATDEKAELRVPLITVWRIANPLAFGQFSNDSMVRRGFRHQQSLDEIMVVKGVPVKIQYQIDIISDKRTEVDDIFRELAMYLYESGVLNVKFDMGEGVEPLHREFTLQIIDNSPNTDYASFSDKGKLYRETINVEIPNAELIFVRTGKTVKDIPVRLCQVKEGSEDVEVN